MYHRILPAPKTGPAVQAGMVVEPDTLDLHLQVLRRRFEIVPLSDMIHPVVRHPGKKPLCALTFDDGWSDFYEFAFPIVRKHEVPVTVFLPTDLIGTKQWFWTDCLGHLLSELAASRDAQRIQRPLGDPVLADIMDSPGNQSERLEHAIAVLKRHGAEEVERVVTELSRAVGKPAQPTGRAFLTWEEVREMMESGFVHFGSHTASHRLLTSLPEDQAWHELTKSRDELLAHKAADANFLSFSYPNGNYSERLSRMVKEAGYHLAVTTQRGWHMPSDDIHAIKRIAVHQDIASCEATLTWRMVSLL